MGANQGDLSKKNISSYSYQFVNSIKEKEKKNKNKEVLFNYNSSILLVNQVFEYLIFQIKSQNLKQIAKIKNRIYNSTIVCFKKSNKFVAGNFIKQIITQSLIAINNNKIISKSKISIEVNCLILNNAENQIIAGGYQKIVIFNIQNGLSVSQEFSIQNNWIADLSISEFDTYLSINIDENFIMIMEQYVKETQSIWIEKQKIEISSSNSKSIFINNNILINKLKDQELLFIYEYDIQKQLFNCVKEIQLTGKSHKFQVAQLKFNQQLKIVAITNKNNINFIKIINSDNFELQQILTSQHEIIKGDFSQDGDYFALLTQDKNEILLYKLMKNSEK